MRPYALRAVLALLGGFCVLALPLSGARAAFQGGNGKIAYVSGAAIMLADADGTGSAVATAGDNPSWNGEGTKIAYDVGGTVQVYTAFGPGAGGAPTTIDTGTNPAFSPDGTKVAYVSPGGEILVMNADGSGSATNLTQSGADDTDPAWSPDGSRIAFARGTASTHAIFTMSASDGSGQTQVTSSGADDTRPNYSPTGTTIVFESDRDGAVQHQIYSVSASGGNQTRLTNTTENEHEPAYSPDGSSVLFARDTGATGIYSVPAGGGSATLLIAGANSSPDEQPTIVAGTPFITGFSPTQGVTLTANPGTWQGVNITFTYQWQRCDASNFCVNIDTGTTHTTTGADVGTQIQVIATGTNGGSSAVATSGKTAPIGGGPGPVNTVLPTITLPIGFDAPQLGYFLTASTGTWSGLTPITFKYQWTKCDDKTKNCYDIDGATSSFYTPTPDVANWDISVTVTATNSAGSSYVRAIPTLPATAAPPSNHGSPVITGENYVKSALTATQGIWQGYFPITVTLQWKRCDAFGTLESCVDIPGATGDTYVLQEADLDKTIRVYATATNAVKSVTQFSNHTFPTLPERHFKPGNTQFPLVTGTPRPGFLLRTTVGLWTGDFPQTQTYQWERCDATGSSCKPIAKATKNRYTVTTKDLGSTIRVKVTATNAYGSDSAESIPTDPVTRTAAPRKGRKIVGTSRSDYLPGSGGNDSILGNDGNDTLLGGDGNDQLDGGPGNDVIDGGKGADRIQGGAGSDTILAADGFVDLVDCGLGNDRVVADRNDKLTACESISYTDAGSTAQAGSPPLDQPLP